MDLGRNSSRSAAETARHENCESTIEDSSQMEFDRRFKLFLVLAAVFVTCLLVGDIMGGKLVETTLFGLPFTVTVGMIPFPVTFLLTDLLNEFYGKRAARLVTWIGLGMAALAYLLIFVAAAVPIADMTRATDWQGVTQDSFTRVFVGSQRMIAASLTAYVVAQFVDISVFHVLRRMTGERHLWLRATGSTAVSQLIDTVVINCVAWGGILSFSKILTIIGSAYTLKIFIALGLTPLIYAGHAFIERVFNLTPVPVDAPPGGGLVPTRDA
jgi:queuosine precursor transporter